MTVFRKNNGERKLRVGWRLVIYALVCGSIALLTMFIAANFARYMLSFLRRVVVYGLLLAAAISGASIMAQIEKRPISVYGLDFGKATGKLFLQGWIAGLLEVSAIIGVIALFHGYSFGTLAEHGSTAFEYGFYWADAFVLISAFLQFLFRGYIQFTLADGFGFWSAAVIISALFGLVYLRGPVAQWVGALVLFAVGMFWCLTLERTGSLWFAIGMQASFELGANYLFSTGSVGPIYGADEHLSHAVMSGSPWITGGAMGVEASLLRLVTIAILFVVVDKIYPLKKPATTVDLSSSGMSTSK